MHLLEHIVVFYAGSALELTPNSKSSMLGPKARGLVLFDFDDVSRGIKRSMRKTSIIRSAPAPNPPPHKIEASPLEK